jgi:hypothetical protein
VHGMHRGGADVTAIDPSIAARTPLESLSRGVLLKLLQQSWQRPPERDIQRALWGVADEKAAQCSATWAAACKEYDKRLREMLAASEAWRARPTQKNAAAYEQASDRYKEARKAERRAWGRMTRVQREADRIYQRLEALQ